MQGFGLQSLLGSLWQKQTISHYNLIVTQILTMKIRITFWLQKEKDKKTPCSIQLYFRIHLNSSKYISPQLTTDDLFTKQVKQCLENTIAPQIIYMDISIFRTRKQLRRHLLQYNVSS